MNYGVGKDICICSPDGKGGYIDNPAPYWKAMPKMHPDRYDDNGKDFWWVDEEFYVRVKNRVFHVRPGFDFDGASIPQWAWSKIGHPLQMWILLAALIHDLLYATNLLDRNECDWLFLDIIQACDRATISYRKWKIMKLLDESGRWSRRNLCYSAVFLAGRFVYPKKLGDIIKYRKLGEIIKIRETLEPLLS